MAEGAASLIVFRADGNAEMGLGHLYRSAALAEMLLPLHRVVLFTRIIDLGLRERFSTVFERIVVLGTEESDEAEEAGRCLRLTERMAEEFFEDVAVPRLVFVLDGYHFRTAYQRVLLSPGRRLICIDDIHAYPFLADAIINHAGGVEERDYDAAAHTIFCLGPRYALLRAPFRKACQVVATGSQSSENRCLVCFGGADPPNATLAVVRELLERRPGLAVDVVIGSAYRHTKALGALVDTRPDRITLHRNLDASSMARLMQSSTCGVVSPSTVSFEYLSVGGDLYLKTIADNQADIYRYYLEAGLGFAFDEEFPVTDPARLSAARNLRAHIFDGKIRQRYLKLIDRLWQTA